MRKILTLLTFVTLAFATNAQVYTKISFLDKFDDILKEEKKKARVTQTDTTFTIEVKRQEPLVLYIIGELDSLGSKNAPIDLTGTGVYGYEKTYVVFKYSLKDKIFEYLYLRDMAKFFSKLYTELRNATDDSLYYRQYDSLRVDYSKKHDAYIDSVGKYTFWVVRRTVTTQYAATHLSDMVWLYDENENGLLGDKNVSRIIYRRD